MDTTVIEQGSIPAELMGHFNYANINPLFKTGDKI
jgi:hypothetical protein